MCRLMIPMGLRSRTRELTKKIQRQLSLLISHYSHGTSQISAVDRSGLAISLTTTVNLFFGSHVMVPESGIIMNNQMNGNSAAIHKDTTNHG